MKRHTLLVLALLVASGTVQAQTTQISARGGLLFYDAGNDNSFPIVCPVVQRWRCLLD